MAERGPCPPRLQVLDYFNSLPQIAELVREAVSFITNSSTSDADRLRALDRLQARSGKEEFSLIYIFLARKTSAPACHGCASLLSAQELVEPIDVANDLHTLGGLVPTIDHLGHANASVRAAAAHVIGEGGRGCSCAPAGGTCDGNPSAAGRMC